MMKGIESIEVPYEQQILKSELVSLQTRLADDSIQGVHNTPTYVLEQVLHYVRVFIHAKPNESLEPSLFLSCKAISEIILSTIDCNAKSDEQVDNLASGPGEI